MRGTQFVAGVSCALAVMVSVLVARPAPPARRLRRAAGRRLTDPVPGGLWPAGLWPAGLRPAGLRPGGLRPAGLRPAVRTPRMTVPMLLDLVAAALAGGAAPPRAVAVVAECLDRSGDPAAAALRAFAVRLTSGQPTARGDDEHSAVASLAAALELAMAVGAGPVGLIRAAAEDRRRQSHDEEVRAAHRLAVLVLLPTGLCLLPAFVLLTVVPIVIDLVVG